MRRRVGSRRVLTALGVLWALLLIPSVPLSGHQCHGAIGLLAHSPLYALRALSAFFVLLGVVVLARRLHEGSKLAPF